MTALTLPLDYLLGVSVGLMCMSVIGATAYVTRMNKATSWETFWGRALIVISIISVVLMSRYVMYATKALIQAGLLKL